MNEPWVIHLLGGLRVVSSERIITRFRTQKTAALLAYMAYHRGRSHVRDLLIEMFWPDSEQESGRHSLSLALSSLRNQLEPPGVSDGAVIIADRYSVELNPVAFTTDVHAFEGAVRLAAQARNAPNRLTLFADALDRYTGQLLPGFYDDWITPEQERLAQCTFKPLLSSSHFWRRRGRPSERWRSLIVPWRGCRFTRTGSEN